MASPKNEGFLTEQQREVLKIAVQNAEVLSTSPSPRSPSLLLQELERNAIGGGGGGGKGAAAGPKHCRRSHSGKFVKVKKDGGGGKGTWGKLIDADVDACIDRNDPNYDSDEEPYDLISTSVCDPLDDYKKAVGGVISEYFSTGSVETAISDITELGGPEEYHAYLIKRVVSMAMDKRDKEKEMACVLLSSLYPRLLTSFQICQGFIMLLESTDDLALDIPNAPDVLAVFISRAIVDEILPPAHLNLIKKNLPEACSTGLRVIQIAEKSYLSAPHHAELLEMRWGGTTRITVDQVKKKIIDLLREYVQNGDTDEACRCIRELGVPFFHHEVVKRALILAMEKPECEEKVFKLLVEANDEGLISSSQMSKGFARASEILEDLSLDIPSAKSLFNGLLRKAGSVKGLLDPSSSNNGDDQEEGDNKLKRYKEKVISIIHEYFSSDDIPEIIRSLEELKCPQYNPIFIKKLITLAMDRKNREKEMASVLLSALTMEIFSTDDVANGFSLLLESAEDTALDVLDASDELALFLARAVIDDVLAPLNLEEISNKLPPKCTSGTETLTMARTLSSARHAGERLLRCWGGSTGWAVEDAKDKIEKLLEEYESGGDLGEACRCIREMNLPFFYHEVVKKGLVMGMEKDNTKMMDLLSECFGEGLITINQLTKGFLRVRDALDDLALDIPDAADKFRAYVERARESGWLLPSF